MVTEYNNTHVKGTRTWTHTHTNTHIHTHTHTPHRCVGCEIFELALSDIYLDRYPLPVPCSTLGLRWLLWQIAGGSPFYLDAVKIMLWHNIETCAPVRSPVNSTCVIGAKWTDGSITHKVTKFKALQPINVLSLSYPPSFSFLALFNSGNRREQSGADALYSC